MALHATFFHQPDVKSTAKQSSFDPNRKTNFILVLTGGGAEYVALFFLLRIIQRHFISIEGRRIRTKAATLNKKKMLRDNEDLKEKTQTKNK